MVLLPDGTRIRGRSIDLSLSGICLMLTDSIAAPQQCVVLFEASASGKTVQVNVGARAVYCTCVGTSGFRVGFQFDRSNEVAAKAIRQLMQ